MGRPDPDVIRFTPDELAIITVIGTAPLTVANLQRLCGLSEREARRLIARWHNRGWLAVRLDAQRYLSQHVLRNWRAATETNNSFYAH